jgi:hypothetical protein
MLRSEPRSLNVAAIQRLQQTAGNRAVAQLLGRASGQGAASLAVVQRCGDVPASACGCHELGDVPHRSGGRIGMGAELVSDPAAARALAVAPHSSLAGEEPIVQRQADAGIPADAGVGSPPRGAQLNCVKRLGGCPNTRPAGIPTDEEIRQYNEECRGETNYSDEDVVPTQEECSQETAQEMAQPEPLGPYRVCSRPLQVAPIGNHAYIETPTKRYAVISPLCPQRSTDTPVLVTSAQKWDNSPDPCHKEPNCVNCHPKAGVTDLDACLAAQFSSYAHPSRYRFLGPNSNTFAGTLARGCCADMVPQPSELNWCPGWDDAPASFRGGGRACPPGPSCT